jgi:mannose-1-phosphate guanylyltransferase
MPRVQGNGSASIGGHQEKGSQPWTILLAGGEGRRLSAFVRTVHADNRPKQFATIIGTRSMLQHTYERALRHSAPERILVAITAGQQGWALAQLPQAPKGNFLVQPCNLDTGPAIALAVARVMAQEPSASILVLPTDHFVYPEDALERNLEAALSSIREIHETGMILMGAYPSKPSDGLGWILPEAAVRPDGSSRLLKVRSFIEKPRREAAQRLYESGAFWNTFILAGQVRAFWHSLRQSAPEVTASLARACYQLGGERLHKPEQVFRDIEPFNFSARVLARGSGRLFVMPLAGVSWSDWGTAEGVLESIETLGWEHRLCGRWMETTVPEAREVPLGASI